jgi:hypothetical protein
MLGLALWAKRCTATLGPSLRGKPKLRQAGAVQRLAPRFTGLIRMTAFTVDPKIATFGTSPRCNVIPG